ncbi:hypothetical protein [Blastococcus sp. SYSU DS0541]
MRTCRSVLVVLLAAVGLTVASGAAASVPLEPVGSFDSAGYVDRLIVNGWTFDPETSAAISVHAYVDGRWAAWGTADGNRPDVAAVHPSYGAAHGWSLDLGSLPPGPHRVCVYAINVGRGQTNPLLGCRDVVVPGGGHDPIGNVESARYEGRLLLRGWALDPETYEPIWMRGTVDGLPISYELADRWRPDVEAAHPGTGPWRGWEIDAGPLLAGVHRACITAVNVGRGTGDTLLGCWDFTVAPDPGLNPVGSLDGVELTDRGLLVRGWTFDPETPAPISVAVQVGVPVVRALRAEHPRHDVAAVYPSYGPHHGVQVLVDTPPRGTHRVCLLTSNLGGGTVREVYLGCRTITVPHDGGPQTPPRPPYRSCTDFATRAAAQQFFEEALPYYGDVNDLDPDNDLVACEPEEL